MYSCIWCCCAAAVNPNWIKTLLAKGLIICFVDSIPVFNNRPRSLPKNPSDYIILDNWAFDSWILTDELFAKGLGDLQLIYSEH